jgi:hypothetical protein
MLDHGNIHPWVIAIYGQPQSCIPAEISTFTVNLSWEDPFQNGYLDLPMTCSVHHSIPQGSNRGKSHFESLHVNHTCNCHHSSNNPHRHMNDKGSAPDNARRGSPEYSYSDMSPCGSHRRHRSGKAGPCNDQSLAHSAHLHIL